MNFPIELIYTFLYYGSHVISDTDVQYGHIFSLIVQQMPKKKTKVLFKYFIVFLLPRSSITFAFLYHFMSQYDFLLY